MAKMLKQTGPGISTNGENGTAGRRAKMENWQNGKMVKPVGGRMVKC